MISREAATFYFNTLNQLTFYMALSTVEKLNVNEELFCTDCKILNVYGTVKFFPKQKNISFYIK